MCTFLTKSPSYVTSDGQSREEHFQYNTVQGIQNDEKEETQIIPHVSGSYSYIGTDGILYKVDYYADETGKFLFFHHLNSFIFISWNIKKKTLFAGFHATGDHLPKV